MQIFKFFSHKKITVNMTVIMSCVISYIWISLITMTNMLWINNNVLDNTLVMSGISIILSTIFGCLTSKVFISNKFKKLMVKYFHRTPNDDIWLDVLDFKNGSNLKIYLKNKDYYIIGNYKCYEEKGNDSWIALTGYIKFTCKDDTVINPSHKGDKSVIITVRFSDIDHMEIF